MPNCYFCGAECPSDFDYCLGCDEYFCEYCADPDNRPFGRHTPDEHESPELEDEDDFE